MARYTLLALVIAVSLYAGFDAYSTSNTGILGKIMNIIFSFVVGLAVFNLAFAVFGIIAMLCNQGWW